MGILIRPRAKSPRAFSLGLLVCDSWLGSGRLYSVVDIDCCSAVVASLAGMPRQDLV